MNIGPIMKIESALSTFQTDKYPFVHGVLGDALQLVSKKENRDEYPLWSMISQNDEDRWERTLKRVSEILNLKEPRQLKKQCEVIPEDLAGHPDRFRSFIAEMHTLIRLAGYNFKRFEKILTKINEPTPDYLAYFNETPYTIEVCYARPKESKESLAYDGRVYDVTKLVRRFEEIVEDRLPKFKRQLSVYPEHRKLAAMIYENLPMTAVFLNEFDADRIGRNLLEKANGTIDYILISSMTYRPSSYIVPKP